MTPRTFAAAGLVVAISSLAFGGVHALADDGELALILGESFALSDRVATIAAAAIGAIELVVVASGTWMGTLGRWSSLTSWVLGALLAGLVAVALVGEPGVRCPCGLGPEIGLAGAIVRDVVLLALGLVGARAFRDTPLSVPRYVRVVGAATAVLALAVAMARATGAASGIATDITTQVRLLSRQPGERLAVYSVTNASTEVMTISLAGLSCTCLRTNLSTDEWKLMPSETCRHIVWEDNLAEINEPMGGGLVSVRVSGGSVDDLIRIRVW